MATNPFAAGAAAGAAGSAAVKRPGRAGGDQLVGAIASQLLGVANDTGTHTVGHAGYTISHAADRDKAKGRFGDYKADAKTAAKKASKVILKRNPGIIQSYAKAGHRAEVRADDLQEDAERGMRTRDKAYLKAADNLGLSVAPPEHSRADQIAAMMVGRTNSQAQAWQGFDAVQGRHARERNTNAANAVVNTGLQQGVALNGLLEKVLASLKDESVASTLRSVSNTSSSQRLQALTGLRYLNKDQQTNDLNQQKLLASLTQGPSTSTSTQYSSTGKRLGSTTTTRTR